MGEQRVLSLSVVRVEVRLYRRSRLACDVTQKPSHFEYYLRCHWSGDPQFAEEPSEHWWDDLPRSYEIRRRWEDIVRFHETVERDLIWDYASGCRLVRARVPELPSKGNLDEFVNIIAATGDACALNKGRQSRSHALGEGDLREDLSNLHTTYVEYHLAPYFAELSAVIKELPANVLNFSKVVRQFVTSGPSSLQRQQEKAYESMVNQAELEAAARALRDSPSWQAQRRPPPARALVDARGVPDSQTSSPAMASGARASLSIQKSPPCRATSHYELFAKVGTPQAFGSRCGYDLEKQMAVKGRREMAHRAMLDPIDMNLGRCASQSSVMKTMDRCNQQSHSSPVLLSTGKAALCRATLGSVTPISATPRRTGRNDAMVADRCAGLRTIILGEEPPEQQKGRHQVRPVHVSTGSMIEGSEQDVLIAYATYRRLLQEDEARGAATPAPETLDGADESSEEEGASPENREQRRRRHERKRAAYIRDLGVCRELMPIGWATFFLWVERKIDLADDCRVKSACAALARALKDWRQREASVAQSYLGVSLDMLFQWLWPCAAYNNMTRMLIWIGRHEFEKVRQPTPPLLPRESRFQLEGIFRSICELNPTCRGSITAEELAGGAGQTEAAKLKNIVDADTVKAVCGEGPITLPRFLELMCEDNFLAHENARHVTLGDGRRLILAVRNDLGCRGWVCPDEPDQESQWRLVDAIESEARRWMRQSAVLREQLPSAASRCPSRGKQRKHASSRLSVAGVV